MIKLFELGDDYIVTLNKVWLSTIPEFKKLISRDKGMVGDVAGRFKKKSTLEFTYIYHMYDFHSPFENYKLEEKIEQVEELTGISSKAVAEDEDMQTAIAKYKSLLANSSVTLRGLRSIKRAVDQMWDFFDSVDYRSLDEYGKLVYSVKNVQENINQMPKTLEAVSALEKLVKQELEGDTGMRGDAEKGFEEDPEY